MLSQMHSSVVCYRPQTKLLEGNVFTPVCQSFCSQGREGCLCMMSLPVWLPGPMFLLRGSSVPRGLCLTASVSRGVFVKAGLCLRISVREISPEGTWDQRQRPPPDKDPLTETPLDREPPPYDKDPSGTHPTGMHSCCANLSFPSI